MKNFILSLALITFSIQMNTSAQTNVPTYEGQIKQVPVDSTNPYHKSNFPSGSYVEFNEKEQDSRPKAFNQTTSRYENFPSGFNRENFDQPLNSNPSFSSPYPNQQKPVTETVHPLPIKLERTLAIIKPDAVKNNIIGAILTRYEKAGLRIAALEMRQLSKEDASDFYSEHKERPFYKDLVNFMSSGPVVLVVLEGPDAIAKNRELMGSTNPLQANKGTLRSDYASSTTQNAVHGSDSTEAAKREIDDFFDSEEILNRY